MKNWGTQHNYLIHKILKSQLQDFLMQILMINIDKNV